VLKTILAAPTDPNQGDGVMKGQFLTDPVQIVSARRAN
jgi:hypothetical protein